MEKQAANKRQDEGEHEGDNGVLEAVMEAAKAGGMTGKHLAKNSKALQVGM